MNKIQKIWLAVFIALWALPEILWSPVINFIYALINSSRPGGTPIIRDTFLNKADNANVLSGVLLIQAIGLFLSSIYLFINSKNLLHKGWIQTAGVVLFLFSVVVLLLFGLSVSLRHIGF